MADQQPNPGKVRLEARRPDTAPSGDQVEKSEEEKKERKEKKEEKETGKTERAQVKPLPKVATGNNETLICKQVIGVERITFPKETGGVCTRCNSALRMLNHVTVGGNTLAIVCDKDLPRVLSETALIINGLYEVMNKV